MLAWEDRKCKACEGGVAPYNRDEIDNCLSQIDGWQVSDDYKSIYSYPQVSNFKTAVETIQKISDIAESENHHPDLHLTNYKKLQVVLSTHAIRGLSENDFIVAAKINQSLGVV